MAYTGFTNKNVFVIVKDGEATTTLGPIQIADNPSIEQLKEWWSGKPVNLAEKRNKNGQLTRPAQTFNGAKNNDDRLGMLEHFGIPVDDVPDVDLLTNVSFKIEETRYDTFEQFLAANQATRLKRMVTKDAANMSVTDLQAEMAKLSPEERLEFLKKLASGK